MDSGGQDKAADKDTRFPMDASRLELKRRRVMSSSWIAAYFQTTKVVVKLFILCQDFETIRHVEQIEGSGKAL